MSSLREGTFGAATGWSGQPASASTNGEKAMDKDRIAGAAKQAKGAVKEAAGKVVGDAKLKADGKSDKAEGKVQNAVGGVKDAVRDALRK